MTLMEHIRELRNRLFKASLGIVAGMIAGWFLSKWAFEQLKVPYVELMAKHGLPDDFLQMNPGSGLILRLKITLWLALIVAAPIWLYQLWAFIAPGLHRHERKWAYIFTAIAAPLFAIGVTLGFVMAANGLEFLMAQGLAGVTILEVEGYTSFMTGVMLLFGVSFEFPLILLMLNFTGVLTGRKMLKGWRVAVFAATVFAAVTTPDPGPFTMSIFAASLSLLFFITVGVAMINDKRVGRGKEIYEGLSDDETSSIDDFAPEPVEAGAPPSSIAPLERRYDEMT
ncbi:twin-arginine translocase subunit TatC [Catelliglobosispora koreensis]|uniref:twin-arginine translocase subunit TatC n=1 Tax=Catelliglobosispora koreensis TaxID=129052 RepID=UPI000375BFE4|nr:twin-arginine translocase subunit TatC [Catelliglobosispora koreensis]